jgi:hypothetical protein
MNKCIILLFLFSFQLSLGQTDQYNLIPNAYCEAGANAPRNAENSSGPGIIGGHRFNTDIDNWECIEGSCDWYDKNTAGNTYNDFKPSHDLSIDCLSEFDSRFIRIRGQYDETVGVKLRKVLTKGHKYIFRVSTFSQIPDATASLHFSNKMQWLTASKVQKDVLLIERTDNKITPCLQQFQGIFEITEDDLEFLIIEGGNGELSFDNFELFEFCPEVLDETNRIYKIPERSLSATQINAGNPADAYNFPVEITATAGYTQYKASESIVLKPGFLATEGTHFRAYIVPCGYNCPPPQIDGQESQNKDITFFNSCNNTNSTGCFDLGSSKKHGMSYTWTSDDASNLDYLSATNTYPVKFCPTTSISGTGHIKYTVTATNECGESVSQDYIIYYNTKTDNQTVGYSNFTQISRYNNAQYYEIGSFYSSNLYQVIIRVYKENDPNKATIESKTFNAGVDFDATSGYEFFKLNTTLTFDIDYCFETTYKFTCKNKINTHTECMYWGFRPK